MTYAIIRSGGKQHRVATGDVIRVEKLPQRVGDKVEFAEVLLVGGEKDAAKVGQPALAEAKVLGTIVAEDKSAKVLIFKKKRRKQYRRTRGHRQAFTAVKVTKIIT